MLTVNAFRARIFFTVFGLDYNDLIKFTLHIFQENEAIRLKWQKRLEYIMIDEFQDIDGLQYGLMEVLCG